MFTWIFRISLNPYIEDTDRFYRLSADKFKTFSEAYDYVYSDMFKRFEKAYGFRPQRVYITCTKEFRTGYVKFIIRKVI